MPTQLRLNEAQQLYDGLQDPLLSAALIAFFERAKQECVEMLLNAVRHTIRDTMKEARLAGKIEAYENAVHDLEQFAREQIKGASS